MDITESKRKLDISKEGIIDAPHTEAALGNTMQITLGGTFSSIAVLVFKMTSVLVITYPPVYRTTNPAIASTMVMNTLLPPTLVAAPVNGCTEAEGL